jgi:phage baseplate assembly protein W
MTVSSYARPNSLQKVVDVEWLDVNTRLGEGFVPDLLPEIQALNNSLYNLFRCPIYSRGPIFQPEYGASLMHLLHEPLDLITANKIRMVLIQASQRWEPRIKVDVGRTIVMPDLQRSAFRAQVAYDVLATQQKGSANFLFSTRGVTA